MSPDRLVNNTDESQEKAGLDWFSWLGARHISVGQMTRLFRWFAMVGCAAAAVGSNAQPTGVERVDIFLLSLLGVAVAVGLRLTPPATWAGIAILAVVATEPLGVGGQLLVAGCAIVGWRRLGPLGRVAEPNGLAATTTIDEALAAFASIGSTAALLRLQDVLVPRSSAVVVAVAALLLLAGALRHLPVGRRRVLLGVSTAALGVAVGVTVAAALSVADLRRDVENASATAKESVRLVRSGDTDQGLTKLADAEEAFASIDNELRTGWPHVALGVPVVSQNVQALQASASSAHGLIESARVLGETAAFDQLLAGGSVDLDLLDEFRVALDDVDHVANVGERQLDEAESPWLAPIVRSEISKFSDEVTALRSALGRVDGIAEILPTLLGEDEERRYLVLIGNPAEARDLGGFAGGFAVVSASGGELSVRQSGRAPDLNKVSETQDALTGAYPSRFYEHNPWRFPQNYTALADLPTLSRVLAELLPELGGGPLDGVIYLDPYGLEALVALTGPVAMPEFGISLTAKTTANFFVADQYVQFPDKEDRTRIFATLVEAVLGRLGGAATIETSRFGPAIDAVQEGRIAFAPLDDAELAVLKELGAAGEFGHDGDGDFLAVSHLNVGPNKLDAYLHRTVDYDVKINPENLRLSAELVVTFRNDAPAGLTEYVGGNNHDLPKSTNRAMLVVHTPHELVSISGSTEPAFDRTFEEFGLMRHEQLVVVPAGESRTVRIELEGTLTSQDIYRLEIEHQPLVTVDDVVVHVAYGENSLFADEIELRQPTNVVVPID